MKNVIDRKFRILAVNPANGNTYTEENALILCAKDAAVPAALRAYKEACQALGSNPEHIQSITLLIGRVEAFQCNTEQRVPDTFGDELPRCIEGILPERTPTTPASDD